jgi:flagellar basal body-associated protein FliL
MNSIKDGRLRKFSFIYRSLKICVLLLVLVIFLGTVFWAVFRSRTPAYKPADDLPKGEGQVFTGIGRLRISTNDPQPGMVILFVSFVYYPEDKAFSEELALRVGDFRDIIAEYFASFSITGLQEQSEEDLKKELLSRLNAILRLGQIETLFFSDFMIVG